MHAVHADRLLEHGPELRRHVDGPAADGDVRVLVRVTDEAGNTLDSAAQTVLVDNTNPTGSLTAPADGAELSGTVAVSSDSADSGSGVASAEFQRPAGGGAWTTIGTDVNAPYSVDWGTTALGDGDYDLRVVTTDEAGNTFTSATRTVLVDNTAPIVSLTAPTGFVNGAEPDPYTATATTPDGDVDQVELFRCSDASANCGAGSWVSLGVDSNALLRLVADRRRRQPRAARGRDRRQRQHRLRRRQRDDRPDEPDRRADRSGERRPRHRHARRGVQLGGLGLGRRLRGVPAAARGGGAWATIDTDANAPYSVSWNTSALADGDYDLRVITTDDAGNSFTSATRTVTVDNSALRPRT